MKPFMQTPALLGALCLCVIPATSTLAASPESEGTQDSFLLKVVGADGVEKPQQKVPSPPGTSASDDLKWLREQPPRHYTIQLSSTRAPVDLEDPALRSVKDQPLHQVYAAKRTPPHHLLLLGSFASFKAAKGFRDGLELTDKHAWIRSFDEIQALTPN